MAYDIDGALKGNFESFAREINRVSKESLAAAVSRPFDVTTQFSQTWPHNEKPGVYLFLSPKGELLYIGKASCSNTIGGRLNQYFQRSGRPDVGKSVSDKPEGVRFIIAVGLPNDRAWLAPALEEFLILQLRPPRNKNAKGQYEPG